MCFIAHVGSLFQPSEPKKGFLGPQPFQRAPFLVDSCLDRNICIWGVQIVAITAHNEPCSWRKCLKTSFWGPFGGQKCPLRGLWECQNGIKTSKKVEPSQISIWRSFKLLFDLSDHCEVFKGSKRAFLGQIRPRWAPHGIPKVPGSV